MEDGDRGYIWNVQLQGHVDLAISLELGGVITLHLKMAARIAEEGSSE